MRSKPLQRKTQLVAKKRDALKRRTRMRQVKVYRGQMRKNRNGIRVLEACAVKVFKDGREVCTENAAGRREYARRRNLMYERQNGICVICGKWMRPEEATWEHQDGRNPVHRDERIVRDGQPYNGVAHGVCNTEKGSRREPYKYQAVTA